jgi:hypothetical protein
MLAVKWGDAAEISQSEIDFVKRDFLGQRQRFVYSYFNDK